MLTALILVCSLTKTPDLGNCTRDNALDVLYVPATFENPITCFMHGQAYMAGSSIGQDLHEGEAIKVVCVRSSAARFDKADVLR
jgi:hypothetical protein